MINEVYRVRTDGAKSFWRGDANRHWAKKGSLVVIESVHDRGQTIFAHAIGAIHSTPGLQRFRPCDLQRLGEYHEEINA